MLPKKLKLKPELNKLLEVWVAVFTANSLAWHKSSSFGSGGVSPFSQP
jgi:hypothetical protein